MKRRLRTLVTAAAAVGVLGACTSNPGARTVAEDIIDGLDLPDERRACLREALEQTSDEDLRAVAAGSENGNFGTAFNDDTVSEAWRSFVDRLRTDCS